MASVGFPQVQIPGVSRYPTIDFSSLANLPNAFWQGQEQAREAGLRESLSKGLPTTPDGSIDWAKAASIVGQYNPELGMRTAAYANKNTIAPIDLMRLAETGRHNKVIEENYATGKKALTSIPDQYGVNQPAVYDRSTDTVTPIGDNKRYRPISAGDIDKLTSQGQTFAAIKDFVGSFKPEYGGYHVGPVDYSNVAKTVGQLGIGTENSQQAAEWWQAYDRTKNVVRKELYGTALTPTEQRAFEAADIRPGQDPDVIAHNLQIQQTIIERGISKKAEALTKAGFNPDVVNSAYGVDTTTLKRNPIPEPGTTAQAPNNPLPPGYKASAGEQRYPEAGPVPSANDYQMLKQHSNDPQFRTEFEQIYGPGSVDRWLQNDGMGR